LIDSEIDQIVQWLKQGGLQKIVSLCFGHVFLKKERKRQEKREKNAEKREEKQSFHGF
jgi:hypothetical protein